LDEEAGRPAGWVNSAAVFRNACIDVVPPHEVSELISANLSLAAAGCGGRRLLCGLAAVMLRLWNPSW
jgi:hypothetical protein